MPEISEREYDSFKKFQKSKGVNNQNGPIKITSGGSSKVMGFAGIPGSAGVSVKFKKQKQKDETPTNSEVKEKKPLVKDVRSAMKSENITPEEAGNLNSGAGFKPRQSDVASALNAGHITVGEAEDLIGKKANYSNVNRPNSYAPPYKPESSSSTQKALPANSQGALPAPKIRAASKITPPSNMGRQFISVDKSGGAIPMIQGSHGNAVDLTR
jgi:hypothetical protein